ncbi:MAG: 23S rRNA (adenine(2503)-C(2))-methyltransferase RlmN [bacterium]
MSNFDAKIEIFDLTKDELENAVHLKGFPKFRARQIAKWVYLKNLFVFDDMTDISKSDRELLSSFFSITPLAKPEIKLSDDGTKKMIFTLSDGVKIESVIIPEQKRTTLCVSTQAGCPLKCSFCRTGTLGFKRNLTVREIVGQVIAAKTALEKEGNRLSNIVYMGMGEPLLNFENTVKSLLILMDDSMFNFSNRKITVSTAGIADKIVPLGEKTSVNLAVSLHAVNDEKRSNIMEINKKHPLKILLEAIEKYPAHQRKKVVLEYIMLKGFNDTVSDAKELAKIANKLKAKVNLIPFNTFKGAKFEPSPHGEILKFQAFLVSKHITAIIRKSRGEDELAACGQLGKVWS